MTPTTRSSATASPVASSADALRVVGRVCAIHQPNFLPRLSTLAKIFAADYWIVLDDVQFARRDYQHRARIAAVNQPHQHRWLSLPTHLPDGRATLIRDARLASPDRSRNHVGSALQHCYRRSRHWRLVNDIADRVLDSFAETDRTAVVAEHSTKALLNTLEWPGAVIRSSELQARAGRSQRLADLAASTGASTYLCGPGGLRYLDHRPFDAAGIRVEAFGMSNGVAAADSRRLSALHALSSLGTSALAVLFPDKVAGWAKATT